MSYRRAVQREPFRKRSYLMRTICINIIASIIS